MPCCTLIAFLLSQIGLGAARARGHGRLSFLPAGLMGGWKAVVLAAIAGFEIVVASAAMPLIFTGRGRGDAASSFQQAWHICSVDLNPIAGPQLNGPRLRRTVRIAPDQDEGARAVTHMRESKVGIYEHQIRSPS